MKILLISILFTATAFGGSMTINTTAQQDARIVEAVGAILGLGRDATGPEVKAWVIQYIREGVQDYERRKNQTQFVPLAIDPN